ncbi:MAG: anhydro-N-acetylmuramic acid kinase [Methylococcaceae bacterium]|nr:MAG: anhydro-N-acetylmuramic acid kinase [Methylococcaceae bacterium]
MIVEHYVGLMCGTSLDGIDAALVSFHNEIPTLTASHFQALPSALRENLVHLSLSSEVSIATLGQVDAEVGELFAECALAVVRAAGLSPTHISAIGSHGITIRHAPEPPAPFTLQLGDANRIAEITGITTVADLRRRDIAAGGHGAPLVPAFHQAVLADSGENRVVLNIGGIANITVLPKDPNQAVIGFDTGPGNTLLDYWAQQHLGQPVDGDGAWSAGGHCLPALLEILLDEPYFNRAPPKSTGKELFSPDWLNRRLQKLGRQPSAVDVQTTLAHLTAHSIAQAVCDHAKDTERVLVCGGGVHNRHVMALLQDLLAYRGISRVESTGLHGLEPDWVEAMAFAWLARRHLQGQPGNLPSVTGARHAVLLGAVYPGQLS